MLLMNNGGSSSKTYIDDLFISYLRTGNGSVQTITTGFKPDLIWTKSRSATTGHRLVDSVRGAGNSLESNSTLAQQSEATGITAFSSMGYSVGADSDYNTNLATYVDWCWKKAPKFFDVVTYTGNGVAGRQIPHSLGVVPGMVVIKRTDFVDNWAVWHRGLTSGNYIILNTTAAQTTTAAPFFFGNGTVTVDPTSTVFTVGNNSSTNDSGGTYVAYLFAHDPSADGIIQCGSYVGNGSTNGPEVVLGWEPQFLLVRASSTTGSWQLFDTMRGIPVTGADATLAANDSIAEVDNTDIINVSATGFYPTTTSIALNGNGSTYIYLAIRRPNKPPTSGMKVFSPTVYTGTNADNRLVNTDITADMVMVRQRNDNVLGGMVVGDRLRGNAYVLTGSSAAEKTDVDSLMTPTVGYGNAFSAMNGFGVGNNPGSKLNIDTTANNHVALAFKRAPGFFSTFDYTGTGVSRTTPHDLLAIPDLLIVKARGRIRDWQVWYNGLNANEKLVLNSNTAKVTDATTWNSTLPTATNITVGTSVNTNENGATYIAYAFSNLPGIQKIGTYVGDGTSGRVIDCSFVAGARFVCIKAVSTTGSWLISDSARGLTSTADPYIQLNATAAEITTEDWLDPSSVGFIVNNVSSSNANASGVTYMYWAIS